LDKNNIMGQKIKHRQRSGASRHKAPRKYNAQDYTVENFNRKLQERSSAHTKGVLESRNKQSFSLEEDMYNYTQEDLLS
jgi:hypothetical protein